MKKYIGEPYMSKNDLQRQFRPDTIVFVGDMRDIFSYDVPDFLLAEIFRVVKKWPKTDFLFLTKNPQRYLKLLEVGIKIPENAILGATIESNRNYPAISNAPRQKSRIEAMKKLRKDTKYSLFISIEPILDFDPVPFVADIMEIQPWAVAIGYDNYNNHLPEPRLRLTQALIGALRDDLGYMVVEKTIRKAWWEKQDIHTLVEFTGVEK